MFHKKSVSNMLIKSILIICYAMCLVSSSTLDIYKNARLGHRIVQTRYGRLHGLILPLDNYRFLRSVEAFLGVPYATPPTKQNRFSPTRAPAPWDGIRISDKYSPVCPQRLPNIQNETAALEKMPKGRLEYLKRLMPFLQNQSEDCLYLNVFSPVHAATSEKKLPVIVFLHGESFEWSSGNPYDGTVLASYGEVVVVTLNYRLGILGFLNANPSPQLRARVANYGLMDQMAALHWVQQNINKFGGDPTMVTLAGHGTGAACINFLMTSPTMVPGLFHRAILLSGSSFSSWALVEDPVIYAIKLAKEVNCTIPIDLMKHHEQIVDCLRDIPLEDLYSADIQAPNFLTAFGPSVDGVVIRPGHTYQDTGDEQILGNNNNRNSKRTADNLGHYDVLFGVVTGEAIWRFSAHDIQNGFEGERRDKIIRTYVRNAYNYHLNEIFYTIVNEYTDWERTSQHPINTRDTAVAALSDAQFVAPLIRTGDLLAPPSIIPLGQEKTGPKCYFYVFDYQTKDGDYPQRMGTVHGEDLPYIFGAPLVDGFSHFPSNYTKSEVALSEAVMIYWTNFARTGNPNEHHRQDSVLPASKERNRFRSITWEEYDSLHQKYLEIGMKPRIKNHFRAHQLSIWLRLIPELHKAGMEDVIARHNLFRNHDDMSLYDGPVKPDSLSSRLIYIEDAMKRNRGNSSDLMAAGGILNDITTVEPGGAYTTCIPIGGNYTSGGNFSPTTIVNATTDTLSGLEAAGYAAYSTALSVTIAIGCSLLILNVLIFAGVYYQRDKTRLEVKSLQTQYQQRGVHHQQVPPFDPIKHAHYHMGHNQQSNIIVDVENHHVSNDHQNTILLTNDIKSPHICSNTMQINTTGCSTNSSSNIVGTKISLNDNTNNVYTNTNNNNSKQTNNRIINNTNNNEQHLKIATNQTFGRSNQCSNSSSNSNTGVGGGGISSGTNNPNYNHNSGMMTLPKASSMHHSTSMNYTRSGLVSNNHINSSGNNNNNNNNNNGGGGGGLVSDCMTLPRNISTNHNNTTTDGMKLQPNGNVMTGVVHHIRSNGPRPPIRTASTVVTSPPEQLQQQHLNQSHQHQQHQHGATMLKHSHQDSMCSVASSMGGGSSQSGSIITGQNLQMTTTSSHLQQQVPQAAMDEMRV